MKPRSLGTSLVALSALVLACGSPRAPATRPPGNAGTPASASPRFELVVEDHLASGGYWLLRASPGLPWIAADGSFAIGTGGRFDGARTLVRYELDARDRGAGTVLATLTGPNDAVGLAAAQAAVDALVATSTLRSMQGLPSAAGVHGYFDDGRAAVEDGDAGLTLDVAGKRVRAAPPPWVGNEPAWHATCPGESLSLGGAAVDLTSGRLLVCPYVEHSEEYCPAATGGCYLVGWDPREVPTAARVTTGEYADRIPVRAAGLPALSADGQQVLALRFPDRDQDPVRTVQLVAVPVGGGTVAVLAEAVLDASDGDAQLERLIAAIEAHARGATVLEPEATVAAHDALKAAAGFDPVCELGSAWQSPDGSVAFLGLFPDLFLVGRDPCEGEPYVAVRVPQ